MIVMIDKNNRDRHADILAQSFRLRHTIFVKERGWIDLEKDGELEKDEYDTDDTVYMVLLDDDRNVVGGYRLYPTTGDYMISDHFAQMIEGAMPHRPDVMEYSRVMLTRHVRKTPVYFEMPVSLMEYGLSQGLVGVMALARTLKIPGIQMLGWDIIPLGLPKEIDGESHMAVMFEINETSLSRMRKQGNITGSVFDERSPLRKIA